MATNIVHEAGDQLDVVVTHPTNPTSSQPCRWGSKVGIALADKHPTSGTTPVKFNGVAKVTAKAINAGGNSAIADGDDLFYTDEDTPPISKKNTGKLVGQAMQALAAGTTGTIRVRLNG